MELRIRDKNNLIDTDFGNWLIPIVKTRLINSIKSYKLTHWDKYLSTSDAVSRLYNKIYKSSDIIVFAAQNLKCFGNAGEISITFDNTKLVPGFDRLLLSQAVKLLNYGNQDIKGCPIFTETFDFIAKDIDSYVGLYYRL